MRAREEGQSSVEFALVAPLILGTVFLVLQAGLLMTNQLLIAAAAREGVREAAVSADPARAQEAARRAAPRLRTEVEVDLGTGLTGDPVRVTVRTHPVALPLVGRLLVGRTQAASAIMRLERGR
ncbi:MAG: TadE/TadG family type IV pilus assembly protein [Actinomycetota bacterium]